MSTPVEKSFAPSDPAIPTRSPALKHRPRRTGSLKELGIFCLLVLVCAITFWRNHDFLGADNLQNLARLVGIYGIFSIGVGVVIMTGGIDLSVGSMFALQGVLLAIALNSWHWNPVLAIIAALLLTMVLGFFHGILVTRLNLQPFLVTLCGLLIYRGLARFVSGDSTEGFGSGEGYTGLVNLATGSFMGIPNPFIIMAIIAVIMWVVVHRSIFGRYLFAVGRNEEAASYSGVDSRRIIMTAYIISGLLAGFAGILLAFYTNSISPSSHGNSYELYGIAAAVLGGCSLQGGEGSVVGILIGTVLLQVLANLVNLLGIPSSLNFAVVGAVILLGVITDQIVKKRTEARASRTVA